MQLANFNISCECIESLFLPNDVKMVSAVYRPETRSIVVTCTGEGLPEIVEGEQVPECMLIVHTVHTKSNTNPPFGGQSNGPYYRAEIKAVDPVGSSTMEDVVATVNAALMVRNA